ncbi:MAG: ATP-binding protein [Lachnospiraceae bacterium]|nr:ATP-binding protein [Lachnospiraceae bacterium]
MLKRKLYTELKKWKEKREKECLLVKGARQVGKTFLINEFGKNEYKNFISINFYENENYKKIFEGSLSANDIYNKMSLYIENFKIIEKETLIFLDEIQFCPSARTALKFLAIDKRCDIIASGSMLGLHYKEIESIPVGYEKQIELYSLDFEEFLWAIGINDNVINTLREECEKSEKVDEGINKKYLEYINDYLVVGGMPEVVVNFVKNRNYQEINEIQNKIIKSYRDDVLKYADNVSKVKILKCFDSITLQLAKDNTKFQYKKIESNGNSKKYENSIEWLVDAGIVKKCHNVKIPQIPLKAFYEIENFKIYMSDIGLLTCMYGLQTQLQLKRNGIKNTGKGGIFENLVFDMLNKKNYELYFYKDERSTQEIEFIYEEDESVIPVEVKSKNGKTISLNNFIKNYKPSVAYKVIYGNKGIEGVKKTIPYYMIGLMKDK